MPIKYRNIPFTFDYKGFGAACRACRLAACLTQDEVGMAVDVTGSAISQAETGNRNNHHISLKLMLDLCNLYDLNPANYFVLVLDYEGN